MKKLLTAAFFLLTLAPVFSQSKNEEAIRKVLNDQLQAWNRGNIDDFMKGYWKSDSLIFVGKSGVTYGYQNTLDNYKKNYKDTVQMGKLFFEVLQVKPLSGDTYFVVGKWFLKRTVGDIGGIYTLLFKKINGKWLIIADHSS
ncbi:YybH family protein [Pinibacter soli]|uniref:Nuclear transport factor 2 family protein n=1 Tax=Pinibacter soli TaxID=3044211 RepID=A0ABT6RJ54_9BACT|nr:nuclear transport factor 2 family protein [Pinibacter soli]MDI3322486.1 nuclear transport factor 2 family protein [Pinibacter soli]